MRIRMFSGWFWKSSIALFPNVSLYSQIYRFSTHVLYMYHTCNIHIVHFLVYKLNLVNKCQNYNAIMLSFAPIQFQWCGLVNSVWRTFTSKLRGCGFKSWSDTVGGLTGVNHLVDIVLCFFQRFNKGIKSFQSTKVHHYFVCN